jgi:hypothetical protein
LSFPSQFYPSEDFKDDIIMELVDGYDEKNVDQSSNQSSSFPSKYLLNRQK